MDYIKEDYDPNTEMVIPRKYFSGGVILGFNPERKAINLGLGSAKSSLLEIKRGKAVRQRIKAGVVTGLVLATIGLTISFPNRRYNRKLWSGVEESIKREYPFLEKSKNPGVRKHAKKKGYPNEESYLQTQDKSRAKYHQASAG